jgi:hypothetical protein
VSWEELETMAAADVRPADHKRDDTDRLHLRVLGSEDGKELMAWLRQQYVEPAVAPPGTEASFAYYREGQRSVIQSLEARIRRALNE